MAVGDDSGWQREADGLKRDVHELWTALDKKRDDDKLDNATRDAKIVELDKHVFNLLDWAGSTRTSMRAIGTAIIAAIALAVLRYLDVIPSP